MIIAAVAIEHMPTRYVVDGVGAVSSVVTADKGANERVLAASVVAFQCCGPSLAQVIAAHCAC